MVESPKKHLQKDFRIIVFSAIFGFALLKSGVIENLFFSIQNFKFFGNFIAGVFFTSIFSVIPATAVFVEMAKFNNLITMAFLGAAGAVFGDFVIFKFAKERVRDDILYLFQWPKKERFKEIFRRRIFRWFFPFFGALIIASPLPDEIGLLMMGVSNTKNSLFVLLSFSFNFFGILAIGLITNAVV